MTSRHEQSRLSLVAVFTQWWFSQEIKARGLANLVYAASPRNASTSASPA
jgi:hypothetical protein